MYKALEFELTENIAIKIHSASAVTKYFRDRQGILFINTMKNMSVDCDCCAAAELGFGTREYELIVL